MGIPGSRLITKPVQATTMGGLYVLAGGSPPGAMILTGEQNQKPERKPLDDGRTPKEATGHNARGSSISGHEVWRRKKLSWPGMLKTSEFRKNVSRSLRIIPAPAIPLCDRVPLKRRFSNLGLAVFEGCCVAVGRETSLVEPHLAFLFLEHRPSPAPYCTCPVISVSGLDLEPPSSGRFFFRVATTRLLVRDCYKTVFDRVHPWLLQTAPPGCVSIPTRVAVITGTPGIGKSLFFAYWFVRLFRDLPTGGRVPYLRHPDQAYLFADGRWSAVPNEGAVRAILAELSPVDAPPLVIFADSVELTGRNPRGPSRDSADEPRVLRQNWVDRQASAQAPGKPTDPPLPLRFTPYPARVFATPGDVAPSPEAGYWIPGRPTSPPSTRSSTPAPAQPPVFPQMTTAPTHPIRDGHAGQLMALARALRCPEPIRLVFVVPAHLKPLYRPLRVHREFASFEQYVLSIEPPSTIALTSPPRTGFDPTMNLDDDVEGDDD
ncbi:hypothetical protein PAPYR_10707 [Paratrimastix pyriformis]|uniref:Uncharacterized protein n=1 Tax=Paratrimastix pyriformis TaxID=342808 RepID=A0ABQ8U885_9EUKA|nr:hypothetical protein PAPYR_10707 [Paratrimastix pyriformis]